MPFPRLHTLTPLAARLLGICALALALGSPAAAQTGRDQAAAAAERQTGGRALAVEPMDTDNGPVWRVKVVTPRGEVRIVLIRADDGRGRRSNRNGADGRDAETGTGQGPQQRGGVGRRNQRPFSAD